MALWQRLGGLKDGVRDLGYTGERRALALLPLCGFGLLYLLLSLNSQPGWGPALLGLALAYFVSFFALAAGWFWARWFASGLGWSGFMVGVMALVLMGWIPALGIYAGLHGLVVLLLLGPKMAARYELLPAWRERYAMDEFGVARLGKAVTRGASALPTLILWALAPREQALGMMVVSQAAGVAMALGLGLLLLGLVGLVKQRGFSLLALAGAAAAVAVGAGLAYFTPIPLQGAFADTSSNDLALQLFTRASTPALALAFLTASFSPWALPLLRYLRR